MTEAEFRSLYERLRGEVPWGPGDQRGALNYLGPAQVQAAASEVRLGRTVSLAAPVEHQVTADDPDPAQHRMVQAPGADGDGLEFAADRIAMNIHGNADSHIDALCHVSFDGTLYNGVPPATPSPPAAPLSCPSPPPPTASPAAACSWMFPACAACPGWNPATTSRPTTSPPPSEDQGVRIGQGDILLVRVGHRLRRRERGPWDAAAARAGLHPR